MTRYAERQKKYMSEIQDSLTKSQQAYFNDTYFKTVLERSTRLEKADPNSRAKKMGASDDFSPIYHAVEHALLSATPRARYPAGSGARFALSLMTHFPSLFLDYMLCASTITCREKGLAPPRNMEFD